METLNLIKNDPWLEPFEDAIKGRHQHALDKEAELTNKGKQTLSDFASGYLYFGLHRTADGWVFREWAPNATEIFMVGTFNEWKELKKYSLKRKDYGVWEIKLPADSHETRRSYTRLIVHWEGGCRRTYSCLGNSEWYRTNIPRFSVHRSGHRKSHIKLKKRTFKPNTASFAYLRMPYRYGTTGREGRHLHMSSSENALATHHAKAGYNCIQIMAIQEHPYYGSFRLPCNQFLCRYFAASELLKS